MAIEPFLLQSDGGGAALALSIVVLLWFAIAAVVWSHANTIGRSGPLWAILVFLFGLFSLAPYVLVVVFGGGDAALWRVVTFVFGLLGLVAYGLVVTSGGGDAAAWAILVFLFGLSGIAAYVLVVAGGGGGAVAWGIVLVLFVLFGLAAYGLFVASDGEGAADRICPVCGFRNRKEASFCPDCGLELQTSA